MIAAILRAQWLSMRFNARGRIATLIVACIWYGMWTVGAWAAAIGIAEAPAADVRLYLPVGLAGVFLYWQLMPVISASMGSGLDLRKLLAYPIPHEKLFTVEVLLRLTTAVEMLILLAGGVAGLILGRSASLWLAAAVPLFVVFNLLLSSGTRSVLVRLLARRRLREVIVLLTTMLWVLPRLLMSMGYEGRSLARIGRAMQTVLLPWTAAAHASMGVSPAPGLLSLAAWVAAAGWFGRWQFERGLRYDPTAAQAAREIRGQSRADRLYRLPSLLFPDPLAAIVEKELRSLARTPRFRTVFIMGFTFGLAVWFPVVATESGPRASWFLTVVCVYGLTLLGQVSYWNCFGFDRGAAALYFAAPVPISRVLAGKNLAALIYIYLEVAMIIAVTSLLRIAALGQAIETLVVMGICALYLLALGNLGSVNYPRGLSGDRVSSGGGRGFQGFLFLIYPLALLPVGMAYVARYAFESEFIFGVVLAISGVIGAVFYWIALDSAVNAAGRRREQIVEELSRSDGPVVGD